MKSWWKAVASYPPSWIAMAVVVLTVLVILVLLQPPTVLAIAVIVVGVIAVVVWPLTLSATGTMRQLQFEAPELLQVSEVDLGSLKRELDELDDERPAYQLQAIGEKRDNLVAMLDRRLEAGELTYARYMSTAQQVYLAVVSNLREVVVAMGSISTIDPEYIDNRLGELRAAATVTADAEIRPLEDRRALATTQQAKVQDLLAQNESAMTLLDRTSTALADAPIGLTPQDAEAAMQALEELADRASRYAGA